jgi:mannose-1-phosphate guanylyltransferase
MQIILLSGGSGKRLWPLSNDVRSKQFLKILLDESGNKQSMAQRVYAQIKTVFPNTSITIATNVSQVDSIYSQINGDIDLVLEPERRDTFPAIALSCAYLAFEKSIDLDETVIVLPVDSYTDLNFFHTLTQMAKLISDNTANIVLVGIKPLIPTSKYGYIVPSESISNNAFSVSYFVEKPDEQIAQSLIEKNAYWNAGVFAFKLGYLIDIVKHNYDTNSYNELLNHYSELEKVSFDRKVVETANSVAVVPFLGKWSDIGTWRTLTDEMPTAISGLAVVENVRNTYVINELEIPIIALGTRNLIIAASADGILVSDLTESSQLKNAVEKLETNRPMYEERRWGEYTVVSKDNNSLVKRLFLEKGKSISYQAHKHRDEYWVITSGTGELTLNEESMLVTKGDSLKITRGQKHAIKAITDLRITEIQIGDELSEIDIEKYLT